MPASRKSPRRPPRTRSRRAAAADRAFRRGFNCSQAVVAAFAPSFGLKSDMATRLSQSFGAGMARLGETCGAVTGALMVIGLKYGKVRAGDDKAKEKTYRLARAFMDRFRKSHGSLRCKTLLGHDIGTPGGAKLIKSKGLHDTLCPVLVRSAVVALEKIL